ncbi:unnamed protein product [Bathycoccus prasinos]
MAIAYGTVWQSIDKSNGKKIAIKRITEALCNQRDAKRTTREMFCLKILDKHKNIIKCGIDSDIYMVFEHMEADLHAGWTFKVTNGNLFYITRKLKCILITLQYIHSKDIIHRDIKVERFTSDCFLKNLFKKKPSNILINQDCQIKLADFGLARGIFCKQTQRYACDLTSYRAPEILMKCKAYSKAVDIWSVGCITGELFQRRVLFPGTSTAHQIRIILKVKCNLISLKYYPSFFFQKTTLYSMSWDLKNMSDAILTDMISGAKFDHFSKKLMHKKPLVRLLDGLLACDPQKRITASSGLRDIIFRRFMDTAEENKIVETDSTQNFNRKSKSFCQNKLSLVDLKGKTLQEYRECLYTEILKEKYLLNTGIYQRLHGGNSSF